MTFESQLLGLEQSESIRAIRVELFWTQKVQYWTLKVNYCKNPFRAIRVARVSKTHFEQSESPEQSESTTNLRTNEKNGTKSETCWYKHWIVETSRCGNNNHILLAAMDGWYFLLTDLTLLIWQALKTFRTCNPRATSPSGR